VLDIGYFRSVGRPADRRPGCTQGSEIQDFGAGRVPRSSIMSPLIATLACNCGASYTWRTQHGPRRLLPCQASGRWLRHQSRVEYRETFLVGAQATLKRTGARPWRTAAAVADQSALAWNTRRVVARRPPVTRAGVRRR
jgi:hypothetical protein